MESSTFVLILAALAIGALVGWLAGLPATARLQAALETERVARAAQERIWTQAEQAFREAFSSLSAKALNENNAAFLQLAETRLRQARTEAVADVDARKKAIEDLLSPMAKTL
ncbi:MAG: DNA recombination protein RmuC, partial [Vicinamibacterales bacterium]